MTARDEFDLAGKVAAWIDVRGGKGATLVSPRLAVTVGGPVSGNLLLNDRTFPFESLFQKGRLQLLSLRADGLEPPTELFWPEPPIGGHWVCMQSDKGGLKGWEQGSVRERLPDGSLGLGRTAHQVSVGVPVIVGNQVAGIVSSWSPPEGLRAISCDTILGFLAEAALARLSPSSSTALSRANALRRRTSQDKIHMEHLVAGLWLKEDGPAQR